MSLQDPVIVKGAARSVSLRDPVLVTGATGFVGSHVLRALRERNLAVRLLVRRNEDAERLGGGPVEARVGDLERPETLRHVVKDVRTVIHCAAKVNQNLTGDARSAYSSNERSTKNLVSALEGAPLERFVHVSSIAAIGIRDVGLIDETFPEDPDLAYGKSKLEADRALLDAFRRRGFPVVIVRPPTVYGPGERYNFLSLCRAIASGRFALVGRGENRIDFCAVGNLVEALLGAAERGVPGNVYLVADGPSRPFRETVGVLHSLLFGREARSWHVPLPLAYAVAYPLGALGTLLRRPVPLYPSRVRTMSGDMAFDCGKAERELGYTSAVRFEDAAEETIAWYRNERLL